MDDLAKIDREFSKLVDDSLWWQEVMKECTRRRNVSQLNVPDEHKAAAVHMVMEASLITEQQLTEAKLSPIFIEAVNIIRSLRSGETFPDRLTEIYLERKSPAVQELDETLNRLLSVIADTSLKSEINDALTAQRLTRHLAQHLIEKYRIKELVQKRAVKAIIDLAGKKELIAGSEYPFYFDTYMQGTIGEGAKTVDRADLLAYCVYDPLWSIERIRYNPVSLSFPLKWASDLPISKSRELYEYHQAGNDVLAILIGHYKDVATLSKLTDSIRYCPIVCRHYFLVEEAVQAFKSEMFNVCSISLLSVIEGMIWSFAWWWNERNGPIFDRALSQESYKNADFKLSTKNSKTINRPTVGDLLRNTFFGEEIYDELVEFYCEELFSERNPVLHGREPMYGTAKKAATLFYVIHILMKHITTAFIDDLYNNNMRFEEVIEEGNSA